MRYIASLLATKKNYMVLCDVIFFFSFTITYVHMAKQNINSGL